MPSFGEKVIAARALLGLSQQELAVRAEISDTTLQNVEAGKPSSAKIQSRILRAFAFEGVEFTEDGIKKPDTTITRLEGESWFIELLEDALLTLKNSREKEVLIFGSDNRVSPPAVIEAFRKLKAAGIKIREMVEEGNTYLNGQESDYRWIPSAFFKNYNRVIYGDKVLNDFHTHHILFKNREWAETERNQFNLMWSLLPALDIKSTADERY